MEKEFVPYELALKLKELGFDEECFGWYDFETFKEANIKWSHCSNYDLNWSKLNCTAPLWQQAFDFIREKYNTVVNFHCNDKRWFGEARRINFYERFLDSGYSKPYKTYEEARQAYLEKLIEIIENGN